jgi:hypothetical protein
MKHVVAVIKMFSVPNSVFDLRSPTGPGYSLVQAGTLFRAALDALRKATGIVTVKEPADTNMGARGSRDANAKQQLSLETRVWSLMEGHAGKRVVGEAGPGRWRLAPA